MSIPPVRFHDNAAVNNWVWLLLMTDFHPWQPADLKVQSFGETLLAVADKFGDEAAIGLNLRKH
ncbi:hypothetical protein [Bradyrhizobium genosp. A]|uniref:hypothetical protein n=1 Tax=Bradyrhizobium genosp. A TaxID=83626 RepID=UPI003CF72364